MIGFIKQFFGQSLIYIISPQLPRLLGFFMLPIITQYVTQTDYGVFANIMAFNLMFSYLVNFGFTVNISSIYVNNLNWKKEWGIYFVHNQVLAFLISIIQGVIFYYFFKGQLATNLWYVLFLTVIPNCFFQVTSPFGLKLCQLNQHSTLFGYVAFVSNLCMVLTNIYLVVFQSMGYFAWVIGNFVCLFLQFIGYGYYLFKIGNIKLKASFELNQFLKTLQQTWPSFLYVFTFFLLTWSDQIGRAHV